MSTETSNTSGTDDKRQLEVTTGQLNTLVPETATTGKTYYSDDTDNTRARNNKLMYPIFWNVHAVMDSFT